MHTETFVATKKDAMLVVIENGNVRNCLIDDKPEWTLGRVCPGNTPDIPLNSVIAGRKHGEFICIGGQWYYVDKGSINGTYYNGNKIKNSDKENIVKLHSGDVLRIDSDNLLNPDERGVWILFTTDAIGAEWVKYELGEKTVIGRDEKSDIVINLPYISGNHCEIVCSAGKYYLKDCDSLAGTWLNGEKISSNMMLKEKDKISLCDCHFILVGKSLLYNCNMDKPKTFGGSKDIILKADIETKKVPNSNGPGEKEIIRDVHLEIKSGTLVALLGSSGAGKTTVMNCLNGMDRMGVKGNVYYKGEDLFKNFERLKYLIGSVPQQEIFHDMLTVESELKDAAIMRLPKDTKSKEIKEHVNKAIKQLNLEGVRKNKICKCSGGEKKRVNIAIELVAERQLLCLDEPDAGLDPGMKKELFTILRNLAHEEGKSILVIIHDVSEIDLFDQIIMMTKYENVGRLAFSGSPEEARDYFGRDLKEAYGLLAENPEKYVKGL